MAKRRDDRYLYDYDHHPEWRKSDESWGRYVYDLSRREWVKLVLGSFILAVIFLVVAGAISLVPL